MYNIKAALVFKNRHNVTFTDYGMVVEGPRGGVYLLDGFCTEQWLRSLVNGKMNCGEEPWTVAKYMLKALSMNKIKAVYVNVSESNDFITPREYKGREEFRRKKGLKKLIDSGIMYKIQPIE